MSETTKEIERIERRVLAEMVVQRNQLNASISDLEYRLANPIPPIQVDYAAIEKKSNEWKALSEKWEREREKQLSQKGDVQ